jgi:hypothetical protein
MKQSIVRWYVAKINTRTESRITKYLDTVGTEYFSPSSSNGQLLLPGLIFIHTTYETALQLPQDSGFTMDFLYDPATHQLQFVPDKQMEDFMFLQNHAGQLIILSEPEKLRGGEKVRVISGEFAGIEGEIYRIKGHKRVVVRLGYFGTVALGSYVANENWEKF